MNSKIKISNIFQDVLNLYIETKDIEKAVQIYFENETKEIEGIIDFSDFKVSVLSQVKASKTLQYVDDKNELQHILFNTLNQFDYQFKDEQIEIFKELIKYDKSIIYDEDKIFYRLNILLIKIFEHLEALNRLNDLENESGIVKRGIVKTTHPIIKDAINPRIKTFKDYQQFNDSKESKLMVNLYNDYLENPLEVRAMYQGLNSTGIDSFIGEEKELVNTLFQQQEYLNSATKIEDTHIFRSAQIYSFSFYKENDLTNKALQLKETIKSKNLVNYMNILMESFFDYEFKSKLNTTHINKEIQMKDNFNNLDILEFRTKRNRKEHPIFEEL